MEPKVEIYLRSNWVEVRGPDPTRVQLNIALDGDIGRDEAMWLLLKFIELEINALLRR